MCLCVKKKEKKLTYLLFTRYLVGLVTLKNVSPF
jgi:hypothetical protein